jgi:CheY-like chemotaxis protein
MVTKSKLKIQQQYEAPLAGVVQHSGHSMTNSLDFPRRLILAMEQGRGDPKASAEAAKRGSIAVVEDEKNLLSTYLAFLQGLGFADIFLTENAEDLVFPMERGELNPDVIIIDYRLPNMDGLEAARRIFKKRPKTKIIFTTADDSIREQVIAMGMTLLLKPFSLENLAASVNAQ